MKYFTLFRNLRNIFACNLTCCFFSTQPKFSHHKELVKRLKKNEEMMMYLVNKNTNSFYCVEFFNELGEDATLDLSTTENQEILLPLHQKDDLM